MLSVHNAVYMTAHTPGPTASSKPSSFYLILSGGAAVSSSSSSRLAEPEPESPLLQRTKPATNGAKLVVKMAEVDSKVLQLETDPGTDGREPKPEGEEEEVDDACDGPVVCVCVSYVLVLMWQQLEWGYVDVHMSLSSPERGIASGCICTAGM